MQRGGIVHHGVGVQAATAALFGEEVLPALQIGRRTVGHIDDVVRRTTVCRCLSVVQRQFAVRVLRGEAGVDADVVVGAQGQGGAGAPGHGSIDMDIALVRAVVGGHGLQGDAGAVQVGAEGIGADAAVGLAVAAGGDAEIGGVDQPAAGLASRRQGGHAGAVLDLHMGAAGVDKAAIAAVGRAGIQGAGHLYGASVEVAEQDDLAVLFTQGSGFDYAGVVDHGFQQGFTGIGGEQHLAAIGADQLAVFHQGIDYGLVDLHVEQAVTGKVQSDFIAGRQGDRALVGDDHAVVAHRAAKQGHRAAISRSDLAVVDHAGVVAVAFELVIAGLEIADREIQRGGHQAADVDAGAGTEQHAVGVDDKYPAVGIELAHDLRAVCT